MNFVENYRWNEDGTSALSRPERSEDWTLGFKFAPASVNEKKTGHNVLSFFVNQCGRWDLNPHERNAHKILSLARLPVPTLPLTTSKSWNTVLSWSILFRFLDARHSISEKNNLVNTFSKKTLIIFCPILKEKNSISNTCQAFLKMSQNNWNISPGFFAGAAFGFVGSAHTRPSSGRQGKKLWTFFFAQRIIREFYVKRLSRNKEPLAHYFTILLTTTPLLMRFLHPDHSGDVLAVW